MRKVFLFSLISLYLPTTRFPSRKSNYFSSVQWHFLGGKTRQIGKKIDLVPIKEKHHLPEVELLTVAEDKLFQCWSQEESRNQNFTRINSPSAHSLPSLSTPAANGFVYNINVGSKIMMLVMLLKSVISTTGARVVSQKLNGSKAASQRMLYLSSMQGTLSQIRPAEHSAQSNFTCPHFSFFIIKNFLSSSLL